MDETLKTDATVRDYLLGRISDESRLEGLEELLFSDEEFCSQVALAEDGIINDFVLRRLSAADAESFQATLKGNADRRFKFELTQALREKALARAAPALESKPSLFASLSAFFHRPVYVGAFAVLLITVVSLTIYFSRRSKPDDLAELRSIYKRERPTETRISEFSYAPLAQVRGAPEAPERNHLRRIENNLNDAAEKTSNAQTHHALGVFYLTQQNYSEAIRELEMALKFAEGDARLHNDLGAAHFELAKTKARDNRLEDLAQSLEEFTRATKLDPNLLEALFNRSLALQEMKNLPREAKESWKLYLQKDPSSSWADEARKNLARLESAQSLFKTDPQVLSDFLTAFRNRDDALAQQIHDETKGLLKAPAVPLQISRRYLLALQTGNEVEAKESLEALTFIGNFEQRQHDDLFFAEWANFYANIDRDKIAALLQAKDAFNSAQAITGDYGRSIAQFEEVRDRFARLGNVCEAGIAENWAVQYLVDSAKVAEGRQRLATTIAIAKGRNFKTLLMPAYYWLGVSDYLRSEFSQSNANLKTALRLAETGNNSFEIQHAQDALALSYSRLGEMEPALTYAGKLLNDTSRYYQSENQLWRNDARVADLTLKLKLSAVSLSLSKECLEIAREIAPDGHQVNDSLRHLVDAATATADFDAALTYAGDSMDIALKHVESADNTRTRAELYRSFGDVKSLMKDYRGALADYDHALDLYRSLPEFTFSLYQIHKGKLFCFLSLGERENFAGELHNVIALSETYRKTIREDNSRQAFFANEQHVSDAAIEYTIQAGDSRGAFRFVEDSKARSLLEFVGSRKSIDEIEKDFGSVAHSLTSEAIQSRLPEQIQLVQYSVLPDKLAIWVVSKNRFDLIEKQINAADLEDKIRSYQASIIAKAGAEQLKQTGRELYALLIPPQLDVAKQLCLVPDKSLHQLAFATLVSSEGKYLLQDFPLFYSPSASVMVLASENARSKEQIKNERVLSVGNPDFDREENPNLPDLRAAEDEARTVAASYPKSLELLGADATKEKFLADFTKVDVIHFAGHFVANRQSPRNSKLLFAQGDLRSVELGRFKLSHAKLVVLSACETAFERYNQSEGAIGIARTWLALGTPVVIASQWKVDSEQTKDLMVAFHRNRRIKGMPSAESLRQAQLETLRAEKTSAPFYWAAFSQFGGYANY